MRVNCLKIEFASPFINVSSEDTLSLAGLLIEIKWTLIAKERYNHSVKKYRINYCCKWNIERKWEYLYILYFPYTQKFWLLIEYISLQSNLYNVWKIMLNWTVLKNGTSKYLSSLSDTRSRMPYCGAISRFRSKLSDQAWSHTTAAVVSTIRDAKH